LTEVWAIFLTALASLFLVAVIASAGRCRFLGAVACNRVQLLAGAALAGFVVGLGTLFRPEAPLLLLTAFLVLAAILCAGENSSAWCSPWHSWVLEPRCPRSLDRPQCPNPHEFQPLTPGRHASGELDPKGFMAWERTCYRVRDCYLVSWKLNDEEIRLSDMPG